MRRIELNQSSPQVRSILRIVRDLGYLLLGRYGQFVVTLITIPIVARAIGVEGVGLLAVGMSAYFFGSVIVDFGISQVLTGRVARGQLTDSLRSAYFILRASILALLCLIAAGLSASGNEKLTTLGVGLVSGGIFAVNESWVLYGSRRFASVSAVQTIGRLGYFLAVVYFISIEPAAMTVLLCLGVSGLLTNVVLWRMAGWFRPCRPSPGEVRSLLKIGLPVAAARLLFTSYTSGASLLYSLALSPASLGILSGSDRIARTSQSVYDSLGVALLPRVASKRDDAPGQFWAAVWRSLSIAFILGWVGAILLASLASPIINLLYGPGFGESIDLLRVQAFLLPGAAVGTVATNVTLYVNEDSKAILRASLIGFTFAVATVLLLFARPNPIIAVVCAIAAEWTIATWLTLRARSAYRAWLLTEDPL